MLLIRRFEEKAGQLYGMGFDRRLLPPLYRSGSRRRRHADGLEGRRSGHHRLSRPRPHAGLRHGRQAASWPSSPARRAATPRARAAPCTCSAAEKHFYGGHGIVGAQVSLGTGLAFANRYRGNDHVSARLFRRRRGQPGPGLRELQHGGAVEAPGDLHHREQPLRHGHLGRRAPRRRPTSRKRGVSFNIPGEQVDGMDVARREGRR